MIFARMEKKMNNYIISFSAKIFVGAKDEREARKEAILQLEYETDACWVEILSIEKAEDKNE